MSDSPDILELPLTRRIMIMAAVVLASTLYATTLLVASTLLPQMQGSMAATPDEIAWTTTFNILATAIVTPMTGFLVARFGRRRVMLFCVSGFTVATYLCGQAESLETVVLWRIVQGGVGAPVVPLANAIVLDSFPRRRAGLVSSIFGMTVVLGPVIGPALGGVLAETYNWRWAFYMIVPAGALAARRAAPDPAAGQARRRAIRLDWIGFLALSTAIACVQLVLSRGQRLDWYESPRDHRRDLHRGAGLLPVPGAQPDGGAALPEPAPAARPQLRARHAAGVHLRHAELHADRAAALALAAIRGLSRTRSSA